MKPITRIEHQLDGIINNIDALTDPVTRIEKMLYDIKAGLPTAIEPITRIEYYLAKISGVDVPLPEPVTRVEVYLSAIAGEEIEVPEPITRIEHLLAEWAEQGGGTYETIYGTPPFELVDALAKPLKKLLQYGKCSVSGTDITCNNGTLEVVNGQIVADGTPEVITVQGKNLVDVADMIEKLPWNGSSYRWYSVFVGANKKVCVSYEGTPETGLDFYLVLNVGIDKRGNSSGQWLYHNSNSQLIQNRQVITTGDDGYLNFNCYYNNFAAGVSVQNLQDYVLNKNLQVEYGEVRTDYVPYHHETASAENLYAIDNVADTQDIITGEVTRRTEAVVSDGTTPSGRYIGTVGEGNIIVKALETGYTDDIVSFETEEEKPLNGLIVRMNPVQEGEGDPYPAGGGVNKFDESTVTFNLWYDSSGNPAPSASYGCVSAKIPAKSTAYTLTSFGNSPNTWSILEYASDDSFIKRTHGSGSNQIGVTLDQSTEYIKVQVSCSTENTLTAEILSSYKVLLAEGATAPTAYAPYSNVRPINGWTGIEGRISNKNLFDMDALCTGATIASSRATCNYDSETKTLKAVATWAGSGTITVKAENPTLQMPVFSSLTTCYISFRARGLVLSPNGTTSFGLTFSNGATRSRTTSLDSNGYFKYEFTVPAGVSIKNITFYCSYYYGGGTERPVVIGDEFLFDNLQIEIGSTASDYVDHTGTILPVKFPALGKNKWNPSSTPDVIGLYWAWNIPYETSMKVTLTNNDSSADISGCYIGVSTEGAAGGMEWLVQNGNIVMTSKSFTTKHYICVYTKSTEIIQKLLARFNIMVAVDDDIDAPYEPYNSTIFGGYINLVTGELVGKFRKSIIKSGTHIIDSPAYMGEETTHFYVVMSEDREHLLEAQLNSLCSVAKFRNGVSADGDTNVFAWDGFTLVHFNFANGILGISSSDDVNTRISKVNAWLTANPVEFCYQRINPIIYHLDPLFVESLRGMNNVWSNTNGDTTVYVPLAAIIENVTPQPLKTSEGDNTLTVTAEVEDIEFDVEYKKAAE